MACAESEGSDTKFVSPAGNLPCQVQAEVDKLSESLAADDSEPVEKLVADQFQAYLKSVDDVIRDVVTTEQLRIAWGKSSSVPLLKSYVGARQAAGAPDICVLWIQIHVSRICCV